MLKDSPHRHVAVIQVLVIGALALAVSTLSGCREAPDSKPTSPSAPIEGFVFIQPGHYPIGSSRDERVTGLSYAGPSDQAAAQALLGRELPATKAATTGFYAAIYPVTNRSYADFIKETGHRPPNVTPDEWKTLSPPAGLPIGESGDYEKYVIPAIWVDGKPSPRLIDAPVTLVSYQDAVQYCRWLSTKLGKSVRLPDEVESEIAAGPHAYAWGIGWQSGRSHSGQYWLTPNPVGESSGKPAVIDNFLTVWDTTESGIRDYFGQVYEWTATPSPAVRGSLILKGGGSFVDGPLESRRAARRTVPGNLRHPLIGFRVVIDP